MRRQKGGHVCPKCGAAGAALLDDGTEAEFEPPKRGSGGWAIGAGVLAIVLTGAAGAAWWFRDALPLDMFRPSSQPVITAAAPPDWRMARLEEFGEDLRGGVIGVFGTDGEDRLLAFTALAGGELIAVLAHPGTDGRAERASLVRLDGGAALRAERLPAAEGITGASLAPSGVSGFYLAVTGPEGVRLAAYGEGAAPRWERRIARTAAPLKPALVLAGEDGAVLVGPAEAAGRLAIAGFDTSGAQLWQRTAEAPEEGRMFAHLTEGGGVFVAYEARVLGGAAEVGALWLAPGGETLQAASGVSLDGRLAGALADGGGLLLLEEGDGVRLVRFSSAGERVSEQDVPSARLREVAALVRSELGPAVRAAYPLSDIQTDLSEVWFDESGNEQGSLAWRLPAHTAADLVSSVPGASSLLAGTLGEGAAADAFLLVLPRQGPGEAAGEGPAAPLPAPPLAPAAATVSAPASPAAPVQISGPPAETGEVGRPAGFVCRFVCQEGDIVFPLTKTLGEADDRSAEGLARLHVEACRQLGAGPGEAAPACS